MIRDAKYEDIQSIYDLCLTLKEITPYAKVPTSEQSIKRTCRQCISSPQGFAMVAFRPEDPMLTGVMLAYANTLWFSNQRGVTDFITYSQTPGDGLAMIKKCLKWAWSIPSVVEVTFGQSSGIEVKRTASLYRRAGLVRVGSVFMNVREVE